MKNIEMLGLKPISEEAYGISKTLSAKIISRKVNAINDVISRRLSPEDEGYREALNALILDNHIQYDAVSAMTEIENIDKVIKDTLAFFKANNISTGDSLEFVEEFANFKSEDLFVSNMQKKLELPLTSLASVTSELLSGFTTAIKRFVGPKVIVTILGIIGNIAKSNIIDDISRFTRGVDPRKVNEEQSSMVADGAEFILDGIINALKNQGLSLESSDLIERNRFEIIKVIISKSLPTDIAKMVCKTVDEMRDSRISGAVNMGCKQFPVGPQIDVMQVLTPGANVSVGSNEIECIENIDKYSERLKSLDALINDNIDNAMLSVKEAEELKPLFEQRPCAVRVNITNEEKLKLDEINQMIFVQKAQCTPINNILRDKLFCKAGLVGNGIVLAKIYDPNTMKAIQDKGEMVDSLRDRVAVSLRHKQLRNFVVTELQNHGKQDLLRQYSEIGTQDPFLTEKLALALGEDTDEYRLYIPKIGTQSGVVDGQLVTIYDLQAVMNDPNYASVEYRKNLYRTNDEWYRNVTSWINDNLTNIEPVVLVPDCNHTYKSLLESCKKIGKGEVFELGNGITVDASSLMENCPDLDISKTPISLEEEPVQSNFTQGVNAEQSLTPAQVSYNIEYNKRAAQKFYNEAKYGRFNVIKDQFEHGVFGQQARAVGDQWLNNFCNNPVEKQKRFARYQKEIPEEMRRDQIDQQQRNQECAQYIQSMFMPQQQQVNPHAQYINSLNMTMHNAMPQYYDENGNLINGACDQPVAPVLTMNQNMPVMY